MTASNITKLPIKSEDKPRNILTFSDGYLENLYYGNGWKRLAGLMTGDDVPEMVSKFAKKMKKKKVRPTKGELVTLVGYMVMSRACDYFDDLDKKSGVGDVAPVIPLRRNRDTT